MPKGDPDVRAWAKAAGEHADSYVRDTLDPMIDDMRREARARTLQHEALFESARADIERFRLLVRSLPGELSEQISRAADPGQVSISPVLGEQLSSLASSYPFLAGQVVRLRHALSKQALEDNVAIPAGRQIGLG